MSIRVVRQLLRFQHDLWVLPESISTALVELEEGEEDANKKTQEILRKYKTEILKSKNMVHGGNEHGNVGSMEM